MRRDERAQSQGQSVRTHLVGCAYSKAVPACCRAAAPRVGATTISSEPTRSGSNSPTPSETSPGSPGWRLLSRLNPMAGTIFVTAFLLALLAIIITPLVVMARDTPARRAAERSALVESQALRELELEEAKLRIRAAREESPK